MSLYQDARDSFYLVLRDRLAALNPDRTVLVRGTTRTAVLVAENEMPATTADSQPLGCFVLRWSACAADTTEAMPLEHARCTIAFATAGAPELAGMDRGRTLAAMADELQSMLQPASTPKQGYGGPATAPDLTPVFWSHASFGAVRTEGDALLCEATVQVFAWKEPA